MENMTRNNSTQPEKLDVFSDSITEEELSKKLQTLDVDLSSENHKAVENCKNTHQLTGIPKYLTIAQIAKILQVSKDYVRTLVKNGHLESIKLPGGSTAPVRISTVSFLNLLSHSKTFKQGLKQDSIRQKRQQKVYHGVFSV